MKLQIKLLGNLPVLKGWLYLFFNQLLGSLPNLIRANRTLSKKIENVFNSSITDDDPRMKLPLEHIEKYMSREKTRLSQIEGKAKSMVLGVGIAISLASSGIFLPPTQNLSASSPLVTNMSSIILATAIIFLLVSGYLALRAYKIGPIAMPSLTDHPTLMDTDDMRHKFLLSIESNEMRIIQKTNLVSASMDCLRNGLLVFAIHTFFRLVGIG